MTCVAICPFCGTPQEINFASEKNAAYRCPVCECLYQTLTKKPPDKNDAYLTTNMVKEGKFIMKAV